MTERKLRNCLYVWMTRLGLDQWRIVLEIGGVEDELSYMDVTRSSFYQRAIVRCQPWLLAGGREPPADVMLRGEHLTDEFVETSLVHELLHLHTRDMRAVTRDDLESVLHRDVYDQVEAAMGRAEEQCVDRLAEALVRAFGPTVLPDVTYS